VLSLRSLFSEQRCHGFPRLRRRDEWTPAVKTAGLEHRTPKPFGRRSLPGASIEQIQKTYGHPLPDELQRGRAALDAFDARAGEKGEAHG
jgi:hypothetical protein